MSGQPGGLFQQPQTSYDRACNTGRLILFVSRSGLVGPDLEFGLHQYLRIGPARHKPTTHKRPRASVRKAAKRIEHVASWATKGHVDAHRSHGSSKITCSCQIYTNVLDSRYLKLFGSLLQSVCHSLGGTLKLFCSPLQSGVAHAILSRWRIVSS